MQEGARGSLGRDELDSVSLIRRVCKARRAAIRYYNVQEGNFRLFLPGQFTLVQFLESPGTDSRPSMRWNPSPEYLNKLLEVLIAHIIIRAAQNNDRPDIWRYRHSVPKVISGLTGSALWFIIS